MSDDDDREEISGTLPMQVIFEHVHHKSASIYSVEFPVKTPVRRLKKDIALRVKVDPQYQQWFYKAKELDDRDTILNLGLKRDETIFIKQLPAPTSEAEKLSEAAGLNKE